MPQWQGVGQGQGGGGVGHDGGRGVNDGVGDVPDRRIGLGHVGLGLALVPDVGLEASLVVGVVGDYLDAAVGQLYTILAFKERQSIEQLVGQMKNVQVNMCNVSG